MCGEVISTKVRGYTWKIEEGRVKIANMRSILSWLPVSKDTGDQSNLMFCWLKQSHNFLFQLWHIKSLEVNIVHCHWLYVLVGYSLRPEKDKGILKFT